MQDIISSNPTAQQQSVIQSNTMNIDQQQATTSNQLLFTATIFSQDMSENGGNSHQQVMTLQNPQITNDSSSMMADLNTFMGSQGLNMNQSSSNEQMMAPPNDSDIKDSYKGKFSRMHWKTQLP